MANTPRSRKAKGRRLQDDVQIRLLEQFKDTLEPDDIRKAIMGESGTDLKLSPAAKRVFPFSVECKNQEKINIWQSLEQAEENCVPNTDALLVFKRNRSETYVSLRMETFLKLLQSRLDKLE
jgi:hypothetical protein